MSTSAPGIAVPLGQFFRTEIDQARRLGYGVQSLITGTAAVVRLIPKTQRTKRIAAASAPPGVTAPNIEATVPYDMPQHRLDAAHAALLAALQLARDAG
jgi:hypothetical protein